MKLSVVATLYRSQDDLVQFVERARAAAEALVGDDFEIVLVNDGSPDDSFLVAAELAAHDPRVCVVDLSRNFGHHKAMMTGLAYASGNSVFLIDSDLEEDPAWLATFARKLEDDSCDVVFGVQRRRKGRRFERWSGDVFYWLFRKVTGEALPSDIVTARLMRRDYVDALLAHEEREVFMAGLWHITGFDQRSVQVDKLSLSPTTYNLPRKLHLMIDSITSFSNSPLIFIFYFGLTISLLAAAYFAYVIGFWFVNGPGSDGWTSLMASIWLLGGLIISFIGIIGIYLSKTYMEAKRRPYTLVRSVINGSSPTARTPTPASFARGPTPVIASPVDDPLGDKPQ